MRSVAVGARCISVSLTINIAMQGNDEVVNPLTLGRYLSQVHPRAGERGPADVVRISLL